MPWLFSALTACYTAFLAFLTRGVSLAVKRNRQKAAPPAPQPISVIIAARNELANLPRLLGSLAALDYPETSFELILVNDHSTDGSREYLAQQSLCPRLNVLHFYEDTPPLVGKKAALQQGINLATHDILAFTDADCLVPATWLQEINRSFDATTDYMLAYSLMRRSPQGSAMRLKNYERSVYYALAAAGLHYHIPFTSSACNMAYRKSLFLASGGFDGIGHLRSGDDDLLLMKMMPKLRHGAYNPQPAIQVISIDGADLSSHYHTNIRRASKFRHFPWWLKGLAAFIFAYFGLFYVSLFRLLSGKANRGEQAALGIKTAAELVFTLSHLKLIRQLRLSRLYPVQILVFPAQFLFYALRGTLGKYRWK